MPLWLSWTLFIVLIFGTVPLFVWANTGRPAAAWYAFKRYMLCMAILVVPVAAICGVYWLILML